MKAFMKSTFVALLVCGLVAISAFADSKAKVEKKMVTFAEDITVNGTLLKAGDYEIRFDENTGELSILKDGKVKAKTTAHFEARSDKAKNTALRTIDKGDKVAELIAITFEGSRQNLVVGASGAVTSNK